MTVQELVTDPGIHKGVRPSIQRTRLETTGHDIDYGYFANVFKEQMPLALKKARDDALAQAAITLDKEVADVLSALAQAMGAPAPALMGAGGAGALNRSGRSHQAQTPAQPKRQRRPSENGGPGHGPGGQAASAEPGTEPGNTSGTPRTASVMPSVIAWDVPDGYKGCFARWTTATLTLQVNRQCPLVDVELAEHTRNRRYGPTELAAAREVVVQCMTAAAAEAVLAVELAKKYDEANEKTEATWDFALLEESLTAAASQYRQRHQKVASELTRRIGK